MKDNTLNGTDTKLMTMKEEKPSSSAESVAAARAAESSKSENERICYDPFAKDFLGPRYSRILKSRLVTKIALWYYDRKVPGAIGCIVSRTRYIDDYLETCIKDGIEQLVILGAGYDSRAYRFNQLKGKVMIFEVDLPTTLNVKKEKVKYIFNSLPDNVTYISIDFDKEKLDKKLFQNHYDKNLKTLFIWEDVTMYITADAVDETLAFVAENSGTGSSIIFNYIFQSVVDGTSEVEYADKIRKSYEQRGEPLSFGIKEGIIEEFLSKRGFHQVKNVTGDFFKNTYFKEKNQSRKVCCLCGFVHAKVKPKPR